MDQFRDFLIIDRTAEDVERARYLASLWDPASRVWTGTAAELGEWECGPKGAYNAVDLNRVTLAASYLLTKLKERGYNVPPTEFPAYMVSTEIDPPGAGTARGALFYEGDEATVSAEPMGSSNFLRWEKDGETVSEDPVCTFTPDGDTTLTAVFEAEWVMQSSIVGAGRVGMAILGRSWF